MRWLFLLLLVLNVAYLAWELNREHAQSTVPNVLPRGVERIVLLRELEPANLLDEEIAQGRAQAQVVAAEPAIADPVQAPVTEPAGKNTASLDQIEAKKADMQTVEVASAEIPVVEDGVQAGRQDVVSAAKPAEKPVQAPVA